MTIAVGKLYPPKMFFASGCDTKGSDDDVTNRLAAFFKEAGIPEIIYTTDQEYSLKGMIEEALRRTGRSGKLEAFEAVPEASAVGESASNGRAERAVQSIEDIFRTIKNAL